MTKYYDEVFQKGLIELCISEPTVFSRVRPIFKPEYFDKKFHQTITYLMEFSNQYNCLPTVEQLNVETRLTWNIIEKLQGMPNLHQSVLDTYETFARKQALELAINVCYERIQAGDTTGIDLIIKEAQLISLTRNLGINFWEEPEVWLDYIEKELGIVPTGWKTFDDLMNGGLGWGQLNYVVAPANSGKSLCMQNMALNWSLMGYNVLFFTLEMDKELVGKRLASMTTNIPYRQLGYDIEKTASQIIWKSKQKKPGVLRLIDLPIGCTSVDIEGFIQTYEIETNIIPEMIFIDYADIMTPCDRRIDPNNISRIDKAISLELRNIARERTHNGKKTMVITASQITKDSMDEMEFGMSNIAGGTTKSHNADNIFSVRTNEAMRQRGEYEFKILKARNAGSKDKKFKMSYNIDTLLISDMEEIITTSNIETTSDKPGVQNALALLQGMKQS